MEYNELIDEFLKGPKKLREAIAGMSVQQIDAAPIQGKWSTRQVICHVADFELVSADRMKRVIAEDNPTLLDGDPDLFAARLEYPDRKIEEELDLIEVVRTHLARILRGLKPEVFLRNGNHSAEGPMTLAALIQRTTNHIPHHIQFIKEKRAEMRPYNQA